MSPQLRPVDRIPAEEMRQWADSPLAVSGLTVAYNRKPVLWNIDYVAPPAGLIAIVGPNGAGKSTFIKSVLGLVPRLAGQVAVFGQPVSPHSCLSHPPARPHSRPETDGFERAVSAGTRPRR